MDLDESYEFTPDELKEKITEYVKKTLNSFEIENRL